MLSLRDKYEIDGGTLNMLKNKKFSTQIVFWLEFALALVIPIIICWSTTSTKVLNSNLLFKLLEGAGICGSILMLLAGIPVGVFGIIKAKRMERLRNATIILSILNIIAGLIEILIPVLIFYAVVFRGISH